MTSDTLSQPTSEKLPVIKAERAFCPLANTLDIIGDRWSLLILRDMMLANKSHYNEFLTSPERISTNILADRLKKLENTGLIARHSDNINAKRAAYKLTSRGQAFHPIMIAIAEWGLAHIEGTTIRTAPPQ